MSDGTQAEVPDAPSSGQPSGPQVRSRWARLHWYRNRLAAMSGPEIVYRVEEALKRRTARTRRYDFRAWVRNDTLPAIPGLADGIRRVGAAPGVAAEWRRFRDEVKAGRFRLLNQDWPPRPVPDFHLDPVTGKGWPSNVYCFDIPYRHADAIGDVKYVWELGRLQYLQPLAALAVIDNDSETADLCLDHLDRWLATNPLYKGVHWSSGIEAALRLITLLVVTSLLGERCGPERRRAILQAMAAHAYWIYRYPSRFSSANNHLIAEAAACFLVGTLAPDLRGAQRWESFGRRTLEQEALNQFTADGVPAEQSPTYGAFSLEFLTLCGHVGNLTGRPFTTAYWERLRQAGLFLRDLVDAGGNHPAIGDDDSGRVMFGLPDEPRYVASVLACLSAASGRREIAPPVVEPVLRHAAYGLPAPNRERLASFTHYPAGGYTVARANDRGQEMLAVMDHGPLGYLSIAAHGHADALAVWLHLGGRPVLVDAGTYLYHSGHDWRDFFRSTIAHNTLGLRGMNSSRIAGPFNWAERAITAVSGIDDTPGHWWVEAEHDGFEPETGYRHRRRLGGLPGGGIEIVDQLIGTGGVERVEIGFLFAPDLTVQNLAGGWLISAEGRPLLRLHHEGGLKGWVERGMESPKRGWYSPAFGVKVPAPRLVFAGKMWAGATARFVFALP
jgi:hypothetical protein